MYGFFKVEEKMLVWPMIELSFKSKNNNNKTTKERNRWHSIKEFSCIQVGQHLSIKNPSRFWFFIMNSVDSSVDGNPVTEVCGLLACVFIILKSDFVE